MNAKTVKRRRGAIKIDKLIARRYWMDCTGANGYKVLSEAASSAGSFVKDRDKMKTKPADYLAAAVILHALQEGMITLDKWQNEIRYLWNTDAWTIAIEIMFESVFGRKPDCTNRTTIAQEAEMVWACIKLPYTEEQFAFLVKVDAWRIQEWRSHRGRNFTPGQRRILYGQPLNFQDVPWNKETQEQPKKNDDDLRRWLDERLSQADDEFGGRYGYGVKLPKQRPTSPAVNPEELAHADQDAIDVAFYDLLGGLEL